ncbi:MAG: hypothetical protein ACYTFQ_26400 [Planctomycetota bacterium]|jgi:hypothetical protein
MNATDKIISTVLVALVLSCMVVPFLPAPSMPPGASRFELEISQQRLVPGMTIRELKRSWPNTRKGDEGVWKYHCFVSGYRLVHHWYIVHGERVTVVEVESKYGKATEVRGYRT